MRGCGSGARVSGLASGVSGCRGMGVGVSVDMGWRMRLLDRVGYGVCMVWGMEYGCGCGEWSMWYGYGVWSVRLWDYGVGVMDYEV